METKTEPTLGAEIESKTAVEATIEGQGCGINEGSAKVDTEDQDPGEFETARVESCGGCDCLAGQHLELRAAVDARLLKQNKNYVESDCCGGRAGCIGLE